MAFRLKRKLRLSGLTPISNGRQKYMEEDIPRRLVYDNQIWVTTATLDGKELYAVCTDFTTGKITSDIKVFTVDDRSASMGSIPMQVPPRVSKMVLYMFISGALVLPVLKHPTEQ